MNLRDIQDRLSTARPDLPVKAVLDYLVAHHRGPGGWYSPTDVAAALPEHPVEDVLTTLMLLAGEPFFVLAPHWVFFDDEDDQHDLAVEEVAEALADDEFFHPDSGEPVPDFRETIALFYDPTAGFTRAVREGAR